MRKPKRLYWHNYCSQSFLSIRKIWCVIKEYWGFDDTLGFFLLLIGLGYFLIDIPINTNSLILIFYRDIHAELIGIGITILIITNADQAIRTKIEKQKLILQMGSNDNAFAREAVRQLKLTGWLFNGSTKNIHLTNAQLSGADLEGSDLENAILHQANLEGSNLHDSFLKGADLSWSHLEKANLELANLEDANLSWSKMYESDLRVANLRCADMHRAQLQAADLRGARLHNADLRWANLQGADFRWSKYNENTKWEFSFYDKETYWHSGFDPEFHGCILFNPREDEFLRMKTSNSNNDREVRVWVKKQLELRRDYLEMLIMRGFTKDQTGFDIHKQLESINNEIKDLEEGLNID